MISLNYIKENYKEFHVEIITPNYIETTMCYSSYKYDDTKDIRILVGAKMNFATTSYNIQEYIILLSDLTAIEVVDGTLYYLCNNDDYIYKISAQDLFYFLSKYFDEHPNEDPASGNYFKTLCKFIKYNNVQINNYNTTSNDHGPNIIKYNDMDELSALYGEPCINNKLLEFSGHVLKETIDKYIEGIHDPNIPKIDKDDTSNKFITYDQVIYPSTRDTNKEEDNNLVKEMKPLNFEKI